MSRKISIEEGLKILGVKPEDSIKVDLPVSNPLIWPFLPQIIRREKERMNKEKGNDSSNI